MKKQMSLILTVLLVAALLAGCSGGASSSAPQSQPASAASTGEAAVSAASEVTTGSGSVKIGAVFPTLSIQFCQDIRQGVVDKAAELGYEVVEGVYELDLNKGATMIENFINQKVDAIVAHSIESDSFVTVVDAARAAGIPVVAIDGLINTEVDCYIISDNHLGGELSGSYAGEYLGGQGEVLIITSEPGNVTMNMRNDGFRAGLEKYPDIKITEVMDDGQNGVEGYANTVENALNANPNYNLIITNYSDCTYGALSVVMGNDKFSEIKVMGYDADDQMFEDIKAGTQLIGTIAQYPAFLGSTAVETVGKILAGETVEPTGNVEVGLVNADNVDDFIG